MRAGGESGGLLRGGGEKGVAVGLDQTVSTYL